MLDMSRVDILFLLTKEKIRFYSQINAEANYNLNGYVRLLGGALLSIQILHSLHLHLNRLCICTRHDNVMNFPAMYQTSCKQNKTLLDVGSLHKH